MKKKNILLTYIKRTLLIVVGLVIVTFISVYFLDVYKASASDFNNKYEDSYWTNLESNGFIGYDAWQAEIDATLASLDSTNSAYKVPYAANATDVQKIQAARYKEELTKIYNSISNKNAQVQAAYEAKLAEIGDIKLIDFQAKYRDENFYKKEVMNNGKYRLLLNVISTEFVLEELGANGEVVSTWNSNPTDKDPQALGNQQSTIMNVTFVNGDKTATISPLTYSTYTHSIYASKTEQIIPNYYIKEVKDESGKTTAVQVYYIMEQRGINYGWFPEYITTARLKELIERCNQRVAEYAAENGGAYRKDSSKKEITKFSLTGMKKPEYTQAAIDLWDQVFKNAYKKHDVNSTALGEEVYYLPSYEYLKGNQLNALYRFLYEWCGYTFEDLEQDLIAQYNMEEKLGVKEEERVNTSVESLGTSPRVEIAIEYSLNENGLGVLIPGNSVKTNTNANGEPYEVTNIDVLPYFTSVSRAENADGYAVIPDGSGAILEFDNDKANYPSYSKRIYSSDVTFTSYTLTASTTDILLPMYAYVFTGDVNHNAKAMVVEALDGAAQVTLKADTSNRGKNTFNYAYYNIIYRESQRIVIGTSKFNRNATTQYTKNAVTCDYSFNYMCLDTNKYEANYTGVAKFYRELLIERSKDEAGNAALSTANDTTKNVVIDLTVLGSYSFHDNFLGVGYTNYDSLTTTEQLNAMINEVLAIDELNNRMSLNVYYMGWREEGLKDVSFETIKVSKEIGGKKKLLDAIKNSKSNVTIYPYLEFVEYQEYQKSFGKNHYTARDVGGSYSIKYPYELNSNVFNKKQDAIMALSPAYYTAFASTLAKNYSKTLGVDTIALNGLGSTLSGNYRKNKEVFKVNAVIEQLKSFEILKDSGVNKFAVESPYAYAFEYVSSAYNVPYQSTQYEILDYTVPFYQLVVNGLFDYTGESINANIEKGIAEQLMRCIETGSNLAFTFTYDDSAELIQTNYNTYYYTYYSRWLQDVENCYNQLEGLGIYDCELTAHERLDNNVYRVTYTNETGKVVKIILNYQRTTWTMPGTNTRIPAKSYYVE